MKKMKIIIPVIVAAILLIVAAICVVISAHKKHIALENAEKIFACSYHCGGGMEGSSTDIGLYVNDKCVAVLSYSHVPYNGAEEESFTKEVPFEAIEKIREICKEREILGWGELSDSKILLLDAPTTSISITYGEDECYTFKSNQNLPNKKGDGVFSEICNVLESYK